MDPSKVVHQRRENSFATNSKLTWILRGLLMLFVWAILLTHVQGAPLMHIGKMSPFPRKVPAGSSVELSCELSDPSVAVSLWQIGNGFMYTPRENVALYGQIFIRHHVKISAGGTYLCRAKQRDGRRFSKNIGSISVYTSPTDPPTPVVHQRNAVAIVERDVNLTCKATGTNISSVYWFKRARKISSQQQDIRREQQNKRNISGETWTNTLVLKKVGISARGFYECNVFETGLNGAFWSAHVKLNVLEKTECPELDGKFADPHSKTGYLSCAGGISTKKNCSKGLVWRDEKKACDIPAKVIRWASWSRLKTITNTIGDTVKINCSLTDPGIRVRLKQRVSNGVLVERFVDGCKLSRVGQTFLIHNVNFNDIGIYFCYALHTNVKPKEVVFLKVNPGSFSTFPQGHRNLMVSIGSSVDLNCEGYSVPQPLLSLELLSVDGITKVIPDGHTVTLTGRIFTIHRLDNKMKGKIICRVMSSCSDRQTEVELGFLLPVPRRGILPTPKVFPPSSNPEENTILIVKCTVSGEDIQSIEWYKDKQKIPKEKSSSTASGSALNLNSISKSDAGSYECRVMDFGVGYWAASAVVNVLEGRLTPTAGSPGVVPETPDVFTTISTFEPADISCGSRQDYLQVTLWQEHSSRSSPIKRVPDGVELILQGNVFTITQGRQSDKGKYYCQYAGLRKVPVLGLHVLGLSPPNKAVLIPNTAKIIDYMGGVNIICFIQSIEPPSRVTWLKSDTLGGTQNITDKRIVKSQVSGSQIQLVLQIRNATETDTGTYICRARFGKEIREDSSKLTVRDLRKAEILHHSGLSVVNESQPAELWCTFGGSPQAQVIWKRNGEDLGGCSLRWGAVNCWTESVRRKVSFSNGTSYLRLPKAIHHQDDGFYTCSVENIAGRENITLQLSVQVRPFITKNVTEGPLMIRASDSATLDCSIERSNPLPTLSWWHLPCSTNITACSLSSPGWTRLTITNTSSANQLVIPPSAQHALYKCVAENWLGEDYLTYSILRLDIRPPKIRNFTSRVFVNASQEVRLLCAAVGNPLPNLQWSKNGAQVGTCQGDVHQKTKACRIYPGFGKYKLVWTGTGAELLINKAFHPFDAGDFTCIATNAAGTDKKTVALIIHEKPVIHKLNKTEFRVLSFEAAATIESHALRGLPSPYFTWFHQPIRACISGCKPDSRKWRRVSRSVVNPSTRVPSRISSLFVPPSKSGFFYRCVAENSLGHDDVVFSVHRVDMHTFLPKIVPPPSGLRVDEGSSLTLQCRASDWDFLFLTWQRKDGRSMSSNLVTSGHNMTNTLTVKNVGLHDAGEYLCVGWTANDTKSSMVTVSVTAFTSPVVSLGSNREIHETQTNRTTMRCALTSGYPPPNITWYRNGIKLSLHAIGSVDDCRINGFYYMENHRPPHAEYLVICKPNHVENTGRYQCSAVNSKGFNSSAVFLNVLAKPKIIDVTDQNLPIELGNQVNISCSATGNPAPSVTWVRKTSRGDHAPVPQRDGQNHTLLIHSLGEEDYGDFVCIAKNKFDNDTVVLTIVKPASAEAIVDSSSSKSSIIAVIVVSTALFLLLLIIAAVLYHRRQLYGGFYICTTPPLPDLIPRLDPTVSLIGQVNKLPYEKRWEFPRELLHLDKVIGSGAFGEVYLAEAEGGLITDNSSAVNARHRLSTKRDSRRGSAVSMRGPIRVAVKTLKEGADETEHKDLLSELKILIHIGSHKNIVNLLGACTKGRLCDLSVIIEYCPHGNMLHFLRLRRELYKPTWLPPTEDPDEQFTLTDVVSSAFQVARAMEFLVSRKCIHRDLAARNVLVGTGYVVKVADFGLARDVYKDDKYIKVSSGLVPVKWMAIESLTDRVYSEQSDVWSFGVFLWELFTLGGSPYPSLPPTEIYQYLKEGKRMEYPVDCPDEICSVMSDCWMEKPEDRPNFTALVQRLDHIIESNMAAMGREAYLDLGSEPLEQTDEDGYLRPVDVNMKSAYQPVLPDRKISSSDRDLRGRTAPAAPVTEMLLQERYTELGHKPTGATDATETTKL